MIQRIYIDTSVIGGCFDKEFQEWSIKLFKEFKEGIKKAVVSDVTLDELELAPDFVRNVLSEIPDCNIEHLILDDDAEFLAKQYIDNSAISEKFYEDALHIAIATINNVSALVSWNFKHIVNLNRIRLYNAVNLRNGFNTIEIRSPREILNIPENE